MSDRKPVKRSVAVLIRNGGAILTIRRPDDEAELPGVWGLPAGSYREGESLTDLVERIGRDKLGTALAAGAVVAAGTRERPAYVLDMELVEALMERPPTRGEWRWDVPRALREGMRKGSLCCALGLEACRSAE